MEEEARYDQEICIQTCFLLHVFEVCGCIPVGFDTLNFKEILTNDSGRDAWVGYAKQTLNPHIPKSSIFPVLSQFECNGKYMLKPYVREP